MDEASIRQDLPTYNKKNPVTSPLSVQYGSGVKSSFRGPANLRGTIDKFLKQVFDDTGVNFSRNDFILNAIRYYLRQLLDSKDKEMLLGKLRQTFEIIDSTED